MASMTKRPTAERPLAFFGLIALPLVALPVGWLLPAHGVGLAVRLAAAAACVLLVPGALVVRALGWPAELGVALAAALAWSLGLILFALSLTFLVDGSLGVTIGLLAGVSAIALVVGLHAHRNPVRPVRADVRALLSVALLGLSPAVARSDRRSNGGCRQRAHLQVPSTGEKP